MSSLFKKIFRTKAEDTSGQENTTPVKSGVYFDLSRVAAEEAAREKPAPKTAVGPVPVRSQAAAETTKHFETGENRYKDGEEIGEGGTAVVYKSLDVNLRRPVAIKRFKPSEDSDFVSEMEAASRIQHRNVIQTYDAGIDSKGEYIVMEFIKGQDLERFTLEKTLSAPQFEELVLQSLEGLAATHEGGIIHFDLKPSNIMITERISGGIHVTLVDYGRARLTSIVTAEDYKDTTQGMMGSIYYMSPQQLKKKDLSEKCDLYAIGCVFYNVLTGTHPFEGETSLQVMSSHLQHRVTPLHEAAPHLPKVLCQWVMGLIERDPADRPTSANDALGSFIGKRKEFVNWQNSVSE